LRGDVVRPVVELDALDAEVNMMVEVDDVSVGVEAPGASVDVELPMREAAWLLGQELTVVLMVEGDEEVLGEVRDDAEEVLVNASVGADGPRHVRRVDLGAATA
jgi:hypothetical protein